MSPSVIAAKSFLRGLPIAALQACGVLAIQQGKLAYVFGTAFAINAWWFSNVTNVQQTNRWAFSAGAAFGSLLVVWLLR